MSGIHRGQCVTPTVKRHRSYSSPGAAEEETMNQGKVGDVPHSELMAGISSLLDEKLSKLATREDLLAVAVKVDALSEETKSLREEVNSLKKQEKIMMTRLIDLEGRSRRNNLIFKGLRTTDKTTDFKEVVSKFCNEVLGCDSRVWINRAHPLGRDRSMIIAHIPEDSLVEHIMSRVKALKGTGYVVHRDFPKEVRQKRARLAAVRAEVERVTGRRRMPLVYDHLIVEGVRFTWVDGELKAGQQDGAKRLNELLGRDLSKFIAELQRGDTGQPKEQPEAAPGRQGAETGTDTTSNSG